MYKSPLRFHKYAWIMKDRSVYEERQSEPRKDVIGIIGVDFITHNIPYIIRFRNHPLYLKPSFWASSSNLKTQSLLVTLMFLTLDDFWVVSFGTVIVRTPFSTWALI